MSSYIYSLVSAGLGEGSRCYFHLKKSYLFTDNASVWKLKHDRLHHHGTCYFLKISDYKTKNKRNKNIVEYSLVKFLVKWCELFCKIFILHSGNKSRRVDNLYQISHLLI